MSLYTTYRYQLICDKCQQATGFEEKTPQDIRDLAKSVGWKALVVRTNKFGQFDIEDICENCKKELE